MEETHLVRCAIPFLLLAATLCSSAVAADGLLVMRSTPLYADRSSQKRGDAVLAELVPDQILLPASAHGGNAYFVRWTLFSFDVCVDRVDESLDPERYHVTGLIGNVGGKWTKGWVPKAAVEKFSYDPVLKTIHDASDGGIVLLLPQSYLKGAELKRDAIRFRDFKPPDITNSRSFDAPLARVWRSVIELLSDRQIPIELLDRDSGLLVTKAVPDPLSNTMVCATRYDEQNTVVFNIFLKGNDQTSTVKVNASFAALRGGTPIRCYSNGTLENWLFVGIEQLLQGS